jgi:uncharacterized cupin superfamily protein
MSDASEAIPPSASDPKREPRPLVRAAERGPEQTFSHPFNPSSLIRGVSLSQMAGLERLGIHLIHVPPGKESLVYHSHQGEEEFLYILSGRGMAEIDGHEHEVGPGDFMGFRTPSVAHHLRNPFGEELVYLMGGERRPVEIADFPRHGKRMVRSGARVSIHSIESAEPFEGYPPI